MARTVVGLFDRMEDASDAMRGLLDAGFERDHISMLANDPKGRYARELGIETVTDEDIEASAAETDSVKTGAGIGAAVGGVAGFLAGLGAFLIPGIGPVLGAGPFIAALGGAGLGAAAGGVIGGLTEVGISEEDAQEYAEGVRRGGVLVLVYTDDASADQAADVLNRHNPVDIEERARRWRSENWTGFNENEETFAFKDRPKQQPHDRAAVSRLDYGHGARSYLSGQPVSDYNRAPTEMSNYTDEHIDEWRMYESRFRDDFESRFRSSGGRYEDYQDVYRYGFDAAKQGPYMNAEWDSIRDNLRRGWESRYQDRRWEDYEDAVRHAWEAGRARR